MGHPILLASRKANNLLWQAFLRRRAWRVMVSRSCWIIEMSIGGDVSVGLATNSRKMSDEFIGSGQGET